MILKEITIETTTDGSELVADILNDLSSQGVGIYDVNDLLALEEESDFWDYVDDSSLKTDNSVKVKGYFNPCEIDCIITKLKGRLCFLRENSPFDLGNLNISISEVETDNWNENWKKSYKPIREGRIVIIPNWMQSEVGKDDVVVYMDPGMAFGSGQHESTKMCIRLLQGIDWKNKTAIDVGTGSGILAIIAAKLGANPVEAYDIDDIAVDAARENVELNKEERIIQVGNSNLLENTNKKFDVVIANITSDVLKALAENLKSYLKTDGIVIISGILTMYEKEVLDSYIEKGFKVIERMNMGEWVAFKLSM